VTIFKLVPLKHLCREPVAYGSNISSESYSSTGIRFLRTTDITDRGDLLPPDRGVYVDERLVRDSLLQDGDLLLSRSGTIGRSILFREAVHGPCAHAGYLVRFRCRPSRKVGASFHSATSSASAQGMAYPRHPRRRMERYRSRSRRCATGRYRSRAMRNSLSSTMPPRARTGSRLETSCSCAATGISRSSARAVSLSTFPQNARTPTS
jgi:hypothetical protein